MFSNFSSIPLKPKVCCCIIMQTTLMQKKLKGNVSLKLSFKIRCHASLCLEH